MEKPIDKMSKDDLYDLAVELKIPGLSGMKKKDLLKAVAKAQEVAPESAPEQLKATEPPPAPAVTPEQLQRIEATDDTTLAEALKKTDLPETYRQAFLQEQAKRDAAKELAAKSSEGPQKYEVTKGCKTFSTGYISELAKGSIVSETTHDLEQLKVWGAELRPLVGEVVRVGTDVMGFQITEIVKLGDL